MSTIAADIREITIAHSPDSDDAFMFYGLATNKVQVPGLRFSHTLSDIQTLNQKAMEGEGLYDVSAVSFHAYPYIQNRYAVMTCGGSVGEGYGPMVVATRAFSTSEMKGVRIAVPGKLTTAYLALQLFSPGVETEVVPFDEIIPSVVQGKYEAGLIIHEGQLTYDQSGLYRIVDLGKWWQQMTGLPLPLGGNAIRRSLGQRLISSVSQALRDSIQYALDHREQALAYAMHLHTPPARSSPMISKTPANLLALALLLNAGAIVGAYVWGGVQAGVTKLYIISTYRELMATNGLSRDPSACRAPA